MQFGGTQLKWFLVSEDSKDNVDYFVHNGAQRGFVGLRLPFALKVFSKHRICVSPLAPWLDGDVGGHIQDAPQIL